MKRVFCWLIGLIMIVPLFGVLAEGRVLSESELDYVKSQLEVPDDVKITDYECSNTWFWEGAGITIFDIDLYSGDQWVASAAFDVDTLEACRNFVFYSEDEIDTGRLVYEDSPAAGEDEPTAPVESETGGYTCQYDLYGDGTPETIRLYKEHYASSNDYHDIEIRLNISDVYGNVLADSMLSGEYEMDGPDWRYILYSLGDGRLFVQVQFRWEGTDNHYVIFRIENGSLVDEMHLQDPDPPEECEIYDNIAGKDIFVSNQNTDRLGSAYMEALNRYAAEYGFSFGVRGNNAYANLPDSQRICAVTSQQIDPDGPVPYDSLAFANDGIFSTEASMESTFTLNPSADDDGQAGGSVPQARGAYTTGDVNLREGPGKAYASLMVIPNGSSVQYLGEESVDERGVTWYKVSYDGTDGWCSSKYVALG